MSGDPSMGMDRERREERREARARPEAEAAEERAVAKAASPPAPLLDPWLAFVGAGMAAAAAGYVAASASTFRDVFSSMGVELPWITAVVLENPTAIPAALVTAGAALLALGGVRRATPAGVDVLGVTRLLAAGVGATALGCVAANALVFHALQKALQR